MRAPCYKCPDRKFKCHSTCEKYQAYDEENKRAREKRLEERAITQSHKDHIDAVIMKLNRRLK